MIETEAVEQGLCCESCQEEVNIHGCASCGNSFEDGEKLFCVSHSHTDSEHYCIGCKPVDANSNKQKELP